MATERIELGQPNWAVHPGEVLAEALEDRAMTQAELARRMDRPVKTINEIVNGKAAITHDTAIQLELVLGIPARLWNNLQRDYFETEARLAERRRLDAGSAWVDHFPLSDMVKHAWLPSGGSKTDAFANLLRFFAVSSPSAWERQWATTETAFRRSPAFVDSPFAVSAWLRQGELQAAEIACQTFDAGKLRSMVPALRALTPLDPMAFMPDLVALLAECGVAFVVVPELTGTHLSGAARWLTQEKALVQLSLRHRSDDHFWFALFHEVGHILRSGPRSAFLDVAKPDPVGSPEEAAADRFAASTLIPDADYQRIREAGQFDALAVERSAAELGLPPGIVVGRLQRDGAVLPSKLNYLKRRWQWGDR